MASAVINQIAILTPKEGKFDDVGTYQQWPSDPA